MKIDTKQKILDTARTLFNDRGYNSVSLRDIAKAVGISEGNLTYHYKKKEVLMEALLNEAVDTLPSNTPQTLKELDDIFLDMQQNVQRNMYFFLHYTQLSQTSPEICRKQSARYCVLLEKLRQAFQNFHAAGIIRDELFPDEYSRVIDTLYLSIIYWAPFTQLKQTVQPCDGEYRHHAWSIMFPLLTETGQHELEHIIQIRNA